MGAGLLANAVDQPTDSVTGTPHSRASPLPHFDLHWVIDRISGKEKGDLSKVAFCHCAYFLLSPGGTPCTLVSSHGPFGLMERLQPLLQR